MQLIEAFSFQVIGYGLRFMTFTIKIHTLVN